MNKTYIEYLSHVNPKTLSDKFNELVDQGLLINVKPINGYIYNGTHVLAFSHEGRAEVESKVKPKVTRTRKPKAKVKEGDQ